MTNRKQCAFHSLPLLRFAKPSLGPPVIAILPKRLLVSVRNPRAHTDHARLGGRRDGVEDAGSPFVGRGGVNHDIDGCGGDKVGEAARIADIADEGDDHVLDEGFGFGRGAGAGATVDGVVAERKRDLARGRPR